MIYIKNMENVNKTFTYLLPKSLSFDNYLEVEQDINSQIADLSFKEIVLDASNTNYISSAGLRVILGLKNKGYNVSVINASPVVYDILAMTGFIKIINVERALREVSIEGCKRIGSGVHGTVYSLAPDTIVKVYSSKTSMEEIKNERELSKRAFVLGLPTAIPLDIVRVGNQYGTIFELLNATSCVSYINESQKNMDDFVDKATSLLKQIHAISIDDNSLPSAKESYRRYVIEVKDYLKDNDYQKLTTLFDNIPDSHNLLHCDFHLKNQLMVKDSLMLIDMDTLSIGHPIFELATICDSYYQFGEIDQQTIVDFLGIPIEKANYLWWHISRKYYDDLSDEEYHLMCNKIRIIGLVRAFHFFRKHKYDQGIVDKCLNELIKLFNE